MTIAVRLADSSDVPTIGAIAERAGLFPASAAAEIAAPAWVDDGVDVWMIAEIERTICGFGFAEPERLTDRTWNIRALAVSNSVRRKGVARAIVAGIEQHVKARQCRLIVVDTTNLVDQEPARAFYKANAYEHVATVSDFFADGEDKVTFTKRLD